MMMLEPPGDEEPEDEPDDDMILGMSINQTDNQSGENALM